MELAGRVDGAVVADALTAFTDRSTADRTRWHATLAEVLAPGKSAVVTASEVLDAADLSPLELEGDEPAPYMVTARIDADIQVKDELGEVIEQHRDEDVPLQVIATVAPSGAGGDVEVIVHDVAVPPAGLTG